MELQHGYQSGLSCTPVLRVGYSEPTLRIMCNCTCQTKGYGVIDRLSVITFAACLAAGLLFQSLVYAQASGEGLKLGQPDPATASTLDLGAAPAPSQEAPPTPRPTEKRAAADSANSRVKHGDWDVACAPDGNSCAMAQIGNDTSGTPVLEMVVRQLDDPLEVGDRTAIAVLDVITPLGVVLTEGLTLVIDNGKEEAAPFQICTEQGCLVREPVDQALINRLKRGNSAMISVIAANQGKVTARLSLSGFTKAYDSLK